MRLVEVNGAGWCIQLVSHRRGPGHLIICLLIAGRRANRSCREEGQAESKTQRSHTRQWQRGSSSSTGGRDQLERMLWATQRLWTSAAPGDARSVPGPAPPRPARAGTRRSEASGGWEPPPRPAPPPPSSPGLGADLRPGGDGQGRPAEGRTPHGPRGCREQRPEPPLPRASSPSRPRGCVLELGFLRSFVLRSRDDSKGVCLAFAAASTPPGSKMRRPNLSAGGWIPHYLKQSSCFSPQMHLATRAVPIAAHGCSRASSLCSHYCFCG